ncbi:hypothetical protein [Halostagnicola sp. A-GB9-2]|uniref:hypothetical protein n=1 Tax=Halostagnicola sp. A-GB9-2 TaxID=3048066 RepID=UPI0024BFFD58|nr:hypothetical protein [Halostagnicola sp. A-GB9-2]MDJ1434273.1 hypothetical protein [Halostagnicola sp. A-GB9-2]
MLGLGLLTVGSSGFIASGAFGSDPTNDSEGNWTQVSDIEATDDSSEVAVEAVTDLTGGRLEDLHLEGVEIVASTAIEGDENGLLHSIALESINREAVTTFAQTKQEEAVFLIANVGGVGQENLSGVPVEIRVRAYDQTDPTEQNRVSFSDGFQFPYSVAGQSQSGDDLLQEIVRLDPEEVLCVGIRIDSTRTRNIDEIESFGMSVRNPEEAQ